LAFLRQTAKLNFKPASIDRVEQAVVAELLSKQTFVEQRPDFLISYMRTYRGRRKITQCQIGLCIQVIDRYFKTLTVPAS